MKTTTHDETHPPRRTNEQGFALIATLLVALVLFISVFTVTAIKALENRVTARDQEMTSRAQLLANSALAHSNQQHDRVKEALTKLDIRFDSAVTSVTAQQTAFYQQLYGFCYGDPLNPPPNAPLYATFLESAQKRPSERTVLCDAEDIDRRMTKEKIATSRMSLFVDRLAENNPDVYGERLTSLQERDLWGALARGEPFTRVLSSREGVEDQAVTTMVLQPLSVEKHNATFILSLGQLADRQGGLEGVGRITTSGSGESVLAQRNLGRSSLIRVSLTPPSFARFGYFSNNMGSTVIGSGFRSNGPFHTNGNVVFERNAAQRMQFSSEFRSAGCRNGVQSALIDGVQTAVCSNNEQPDMAFYMGDRTATSRRVPPNATEGRAGHLDTALNADFTLRNAEGEELCNIGGATRVCTSPSDERIRDVNWKAAPVAMPAAALSNFAKAGSAESGGITVDGTYFTNSPDCTENMPRNADQSGPPPNRSTYPLPERCRSLIGSYEGHPTIKLGVIGGRQKIEFAARTIRGYRFIVSARCGKDPSQGDGNGKEQNERGKGQVYVPHPERSITSFLSSAWDVISLLTPFPTAHANDVDWPNCRNGEKTGYSVGWVPLWHNVVFAYDIAEDGTITYDASRSMTPLNSNDERPRQFVRVDTSKPFNGVVYSSHQYNALESVRPYTDENRNEPELASYMRLSIASAGSFVITGDITYAEDIATNPDATNMLGLYARSAIEVKGHANNLRRKHPDLNIDGILLAETGSIRVHRVCERGSMVDKGSINFRGSVIQRNLGETSCTFSDGRFQGYRSNFVYDTRTLRGEAPPLFPEFDNARWNVSVDDPAGQFVRMK